MRIAVVGSGYVGLVTGACLADFGMDVTCVDKDEKKIAALEAGHIPIYEPGLEAVVAKNEKAGRLRYTTNLREAVEHALAVFIAVGTPPAPDGSADLTFIREVATSIGQYLNGYKVVITKSTVPTGTGAMIEQIIREVSGGKFPFGVVSNPEFLREGSAVGDFLEPDRIVVGTTDPAAAAIMRDIYAPLINVGVPMVVSNVESAELIKYASNGFLATKIAFINEIALLCEKMGADVTQVARGMGLDSRIGPQFLQPGPGYGGSCFPKDTSAVADLAKKHGVRFEIVEAVLLANRKTKERMIEKVESLIGPVQGKKVALLGLAFKPETDDLRDSPAIVLLEALVSRGARVVSYDPAGMENAKEQGLPTEYAADAYSCCEGADVLILATEWNEFRSLNLERVKSLLREPAIADLRNVYEPERMRSLGFRYVSVGR
jgi:UDPglucose 6-dehydrogenase